MGDFPLGVDPKPINGRVLVRLIQDSHSTIIIPDTVTVTKPMQGKVEEVSEGYYEEGLFRRHTVQIGDIVIFDWKAGFPLQLDDEEFLIIHERELLAILRGVNYG